MSASISRREWAFSALAASAAATVTKTDKTYAVVGAGVFGSWTAYQLRRAGYNVILLDAYGPANMRASSSGESRIIRAAYGKDEIYTRMAVKSLSQWDAFFERIGRSLLYRTGVLWIAKPDNAYANDSRETLRQVGVAFKDLTFSEVHKLYPQIQLEPGAGAIFEPDSGALMARDAVQALVAQFIRDGGVFRHAAVRTPEASGHLEQILTSDGAPVRADAFVFACGPWLGKVLPDILGKRIFPTRQELFFFGVPPGDRRFEPPQMPVWIDFGDNRGMYGFPDLDTRGFKVAFDLHGPEFDPDTGSRFPSRQKIAEARAYVSERFPALAKSPIVGSRVCQYENTSNGDFVIDRHPAFDNVWICGGGSGHGFKHGPAVGEYTAARVT
ncbi:MAG TPA: FAD-dependent oxidoreductase, partial [Bryobacteraceae bacterium]|nr:FAD-dependent oxidoreductase [Bryobacteraceae bacterium]